MIEVKDLSFAYKIADRKVEVLKNLNFSVQAGEFVGIQGPSGSGKSTLFYILGFLLKPTSGRVSFGEADIMRLSEEELTVLRNQKIGFVFQQFYLLSKTNVLENILLPTRYPSETAPLDNPTAHAKALALAKKLGIDLHLHHLPNQLSGGQQQRVAIARSLMNEVDLILADEPTGNLDSQTAQETLSLLKELNRQGKTIILITHDSEVAQHCSKVYHLRDGAFTNVVENYPAPTHAPALTAQANSFKIPGTLSFGIPWRTMRAVLPLVLENLVRNKAKSLLTMLGVVIGVAAVLAMVTLGQFTKRKILDSYESLGVNKLMIRGYPNRNLRASDKPPVNFTAFTWEKDFLPMKRIFPQVERMSPLLSAWRSTVAAGGIDISEKVGIYGVTPDYFDITNRKLLLGHLLNEFQVKNHSPVCVVGYEIADRLFKKTDPLGQILTISDRSSLNYPCRIIGVMAFQTSNKENSPPNLNVLIPYTYYMSMADNWWSAQIHEAALQIAPQADVEDAGKMVRAYFSKKYGKSGMFLVDSDSTLIAQMKRFLNLFSILLGSIALLSLIVGGIGVNNMMLVSVSERIREFGIRKALGATHRSLRVQILMESITLCAVAGLIGIMLGFSTYELAIFGATKFVPNVKFEWTFEPLAASLSLLAILGVGVASGFVPAVRTERLQVIEALRTE